MLDGDDIITTLANRAGQLVAQFAAVAKDTPSALLAFFFWSLWWVCRFPLISVDQIVRGFIGLFRPHSLAFETTQANAWVAAVIKHVDIGYQTIFVFADETNVGGDPFGRFS